MKTFDYLKHLHGSAQLFEARGFPAVAAAVRSMLATELRNVSSSDFWAFILDLHPGATVEQVFIDGSEYTPNEYLESLKACGCNDRACAFRAGMAERAHMFEKVEMPKHLNNYIPPIEPGKGTILLHPENECMREFYLARGFKVLPNIDERTDLPDYRHT